TTGHDAEVGRSERDMAGELTSDLDGHALGRRRGGVGQIYSEPGKTLHGALAGWELHLYQSPPGSIRFRMHTVRYGSTCRQPRELNRARPDPHSPRELDPAGLASVGLRGAGRGPGGIPGQSPRRDKGWLLLALPRPPGSPGRDAWRLGRDPRRPRHRDL